MVRSRRVLGTRETSALVPVAVLLGVLAWGLANAVIQRSFVVDPVMWQYALLASMALDIVLAMDCEWSSRGKRRPSSGDARGLGLSALFLLGLQACVTVAFHWVDDQPALVVGAIALLVANLIVAAMIRRTLRGGTSVSAHSAGSSNQPVPRSGSADAYPGSDSEPGPAPFVIACSGGGLRASAFVLGGLNAVQAATRGPWAAPPTASPRLVAVSGGSYLAAAMALTRRFWIDEQGQSVRRPDTLPWDEVYRDQTPELRRLRRHTRDLLEPRSELVLGLAALMLGAALNVFLAVAAVRALAWGIAWLMTRAGDLRLGQKCSGNLCSVFDGWAGRGPWWTDETMVMWALLTLVSVAFGVALWIDQGRINRLRDESIPTARADRRDSRRRMRSATQYAAAAWLFGLVVLPGLIAGLNHLALDNAPTAGTASVLTSLGYSTPALCRAAGGQSMVDAVTAAAAAARISPGEKRTERGGACGAFTDVTITIQAQATTCSLSVGTATCPGAPEQWRALGVDLVRAEHSGVGAHSLAKIGGSLVAFLTLLQTLRASITADDAAASRGAGRLRRVLLMRVPILVVGLVGFWLLTRWIFQSAVDPTAAHSLTQVALPVVGLAAAMLVDANVTSMHEFYRGRLASAFAVGRRGDTADELDPNRFYRFSDLGDQSLTIATTANVQAYASVPTRRGGAPVTFDSRNIALHTGTPETSRTVAILDYENAVGYGYASVMSIVAMSGAAVSPMMGRFAATFGPFRLLLALFNIRTGVWVPNPRYAPPEQMVAWTTLREAVKNWPAQPWLTGRPGVAQVAKEAFGQSSFEDQWLYLTDGGHLDNTGLVEAVRIAVTEPPLATDGWRHVLVLDASNDKEGTWAAVGDALAVIRADLAVRLERVARAQWTFATPESVVPTKVGRTAFGRRTVEADTRSEPDFARLYADESLRLYVLVVKAVRPVDLDHAQLPDAVRAFAMATADFPRASTSRQDFSDLEFEAYRQLGEWCTLQAIGPSSWT